MNEQTPCDVPGTLDHAWEAARMRWDDEIDAWCAKREAHVSREYTEFEASRERREADRMRSRARAQAAGHPSAQGLSTTEDAGGRIAAAVVGRRGLKYTPLAERLAAFSEPSPDGCITYTGPLTSRGYGSIKVDGRSRSAHRVAYELAVGPIPDGLHLDHLCRNRACVNPDHLEPVTQWENTRRGESPVAANARKTHCGHGHEFTDENTFVYGDGRRACRACHRDRESLRRAAARRPVDIHFAAPDNGSVEQRPQEVSPPPAEPRTPPPTQRTI